MLDSAGVPHQFGGALALAWYRNPRATTDIDVNLTLPPAAAEPVLELLARLGVTITPEDRAAIAQDGQARLDWDGSYLDVFFATMDFHLEMAECARMVRFGPVDIPILAPEHLVVCKAIFDRPKDWLDIEEMLRWGTEVDAARTLFWVGEILGPESEQYTRLAGLLSAGAAGSRAASPCRPCYRSNWDVATPPPSIPVMADLIRMGDDGTLHVPDEPIIPFIEGDGTGVDIWPAAKLVLDAAAAKHGHSVAWKEVLAGQKAFDEVGSWLPDETVEAFREHLIGIKGPLTTPVGGGIRSLNVALRQILDLYVCLRPVRWFTGVPSPVLHPELVDMVIFRENTEDVYAGYEVQEGSPEADRLTGFLREEMGWPIRDGSGIGIKPISEMGSKRLVRAAVNYALDRKRRSVTLVHKGNIQKFTEGAFREWGYELVREEFSDVAVGWDDCGGDPGDKLLVKDTIADITLQQVLTRPSDFDVIATTNLNGDYLSDALAAQVGGIGIAPGANINYVTGHGIFEATHGTAPKYAGQDKVNPGSVLLSGVLMFEHIGWNDAASDIVHALEATIADKVVTYDFARLMDGATEVKCSEFAAAIVDRL